MTQPAECKECGEFDKLNQDNLCEDCQWWLDLFSAVDTWDGIACND